VGFEIICIEGEGKKGEGGVAVQDASPELNLLFSHLIFSFFQRKSK